jgi:phosphinothricin acetyltransferase
LASYRIRDVLIRHADADRDGAQCAAIYAPFVSDSAVSFEEHVPDAGEFARRIEQLSLRYPWLVAEEDGVIAGYAYAAEHRDRASYRWAADVTVYVGEGWRGRGVGRALYDALLPLLVRQGVQIACAGITLPNDASVALHERFGFALVGVYRRIGWKLGAWRDVGWWQLDLIPASGDPPPELLAPARFTER